MKPKHNLGMGRIIQLTNLAHQPLVLQWPMLRRAETKKGPTKTRPAVRVMGWASLSSLIFSSVLTAASTGSNRISMSTVNNKIRRGVVKGAASLSSCHLDSFARGLVTASGPWRLPCNSSQGCSCPFLCGDFRSRGASGASGCLTFRPIEHPDRPL